MNDKEKEINEQAEKENQNETRKENIFFGLMKWNRDKWEKAAIFILLGVFFLLIATPASKFSSKNKNKPYINEAAKEVTIEKNIKNDEYISRLENKLEQTIGGMEGAGKVEVMITLKDNGEKILDKDRPYESEKTLLHEDGKESESSNIKSEQQTVLVEQEGNTTPIVIQEKYPEIEGVVIVCEGGENTVLALHIKEAVQALFSIDAHKIVVCKLKKQ